MAKGAFNGTLALSWMSELLHFLQEKIPDQEGVWQLWYTQNSDNIFLQKIESKGHGFLHPQFISWRNSQSS